MNKKQLTRMHKKKKEKWIKYNNTIKLKGKIKIVDDPVQEIIPNKEIIIKWWNKVRKLINK